MAPSLSEIEEEEIHFSNVITTFQNYASYSLSANNRRRKDVYQIPQADQEILDKLGYKQKLDEVDNAIRANAEFLKKIVEHPEMFENGLEEDEVDNPTDASPISHDHGHDRDRELFSRSHSHSLHSHNHFHGTHGAPGRRRTYKPTDFDMDKLRSTLKQFVRDWSEEGSEERGVCYKPMKEALVAHFSNVLVKDRVNIRVLVPGAGLGRLAYDVASMGFTCQGNEFSHYMLLASYFILNKTDSIKKHTFYPYVHSFSNVSSREALLRPISIPDVLPSALPPGSNFSLVAGDFEEVYGADADPAEPHSGQWDAILTCFFIDTAKNIVNYFRVIHRILAPGGVWINLGPLLWHFENNNTKDPSIELDLEEIKALARAIGFELSNERIIDTTYTNNPEGMLGYVYHAAFWTATKS